MIMKKKYNLNKNIIDWKVGDKKINFPVNIILPSLITLVLEELDISPTVTFEPATLPAPETLNISKICAVPVTVS